MHACIHTYIHTCIHTGQVLNADPYGFAMPEGHALYEHLRYARTLGGLFRHIQGLFCQISRPLLRIPQVCQYISRSLLPYRSVSLAICTSLFDTYAYLSQATIAVIRDDDFRNEQLQKWNLQQAPQVCVCVCARERVCIYTCTYTYT